MTRTEVSVVIPTFNRSRELSQTLEALDRQTSSSFEVVVADDGSKHPVVDEVEGTFSFPMTHVRQERDGFRLAAARNLGASAASGAPSCSLTAGRCPDRGWWRHTLQQQSEHRRLTSLRWGQRTGYDVAPPYASYVARVFCDAGADFQPHRFFGIPGVADYRELALAAAVHPAEIMMPWRLFWGRNVAVAATAFSNVGGFDENFRSYGVEDIDLGYRLLASGCQVRWERAAWALEIPEVADLSSTQKAAENDSNLRAMQRKYDDVWVEFYRAVRPSARSEQVEGELLEAELRRMTPCAPLRRTEPGPERIVYFGVPEIPIGADDVVLDPCVHRSRSEHDPGLVSSLGMATLFNEGQFDRAVITQRFRPLLAHWSEFVTAEASRLAHRVDRTGSR
ncbi:glycosyltransferase [Curtobacterium flaccumfaciens]|nr:glycosyltransferase [Curtobacterium flaccumfaciens]